MADLNLRVSSGEPIAKIPARWFQEVNDILKNLKVVGKNCTFTKNGTYWTIQVDLTDTEIDSGGGGGGLPDGGSTYQVLQRDGSGDAVWDYVRAVE